MALCYVQRAVGRAVVYDEDVEIAFEPEYGPDYFLDILNLVVCRNDYQFSVHITNIMKNGYLITIPVCGTMFRT